MILTKTQRAILKIFCSSLTESFTIKEIAERIKQNYSIVYSALQDLYKNKFLIKDKHKNFSLDYKKNYNELAYIESLRAEKFLESHKDIALFISRIITEINLAFFILLLFGSYAGGNQKKNSDTEISASKTLRIQQRASDIDILMVIENLEDTEKTEKQVKNISEIYGNFDINVISKESVKEMLANKDKLNVINETLSNHVLFYGAEDYYRMVSS